LMPTPSVLGFACARCPPSRDPRLPGGPSLRTGLVGLTSGSSGCRRSRVDRAWRVTVASQGRWCE
jgi:hypothetical protein